VDDSLCQIATPTKFIISSGNTWPVGDVSYFNDFYGPKSSRCSQAHYS
jgi:hypothetical protein